MNQKLCGRLAEVECAISRKAVTKYREDLGIPNVTGRKGNDKSPNIGPNCSQIHGKL